MKTIRATAAKFAVIVFFIMAIVGSLCGSSPATCCNRAVIGAVAMYIVVSIAGKSVLNIIIDQIIDSSLNTKDKS